MWIDSWADVVRVLTAGYASYTGESVALMLLTGVQLLVVARISMRRPAAWTTIMARPTALLVDAELQIGEPRRNTITGFEVIRSDRVSPVGDPVTAGTVVLRTSGGLM